MGEKKAQEKISIKGLQKNSHLGNKLSYNSSGSIKFNKSDIVWAKITGYPWWPALVTTVPGQKDVGKRSDDPKSYYPWSTIHHNIKAQYRVDFIADDTHAFLRKNYLLDYNTNRDRLYVEGLQFSTRKRRYFQMAVNEADQLQQVMELSKREINQRKGNNVQLKESLMKSGENEDEDEEQSQSKGQQRQKQSDQKSQKQQNQEQNQSQRQDKLNNRPTKGRNNNQNKSNNSSLSISHRTKTSHQQLNSSKKITKSNNNYHYIDQSQLAVKRGRRLSNKPNSLKQTQTKIENLEQNNSIEIEKELFVRFEVSEKEKISNSKNWQQPVIEKQTQVFSQIIQLQSTNQTSHPNTDKPHSPSITVNNELLQPIKKAPDLIFEELLTKYHLNKIDLVQQQFRIQKLAKLKDDVMDSLSNNSASTNRIFIKNAFTTTYIISKKKYSKKASSTTTITPSKQRTTPTNSDIFAQKLSIIRKLKQSDQDKLSNDQKHFLLDTSKRRTARKIYSTVMYNLRKNHNIEQVEEEIKNNIRDKCKRIASVIFEQEGMNDRNKGGGKSAGGVRNYNNKGRVNEGEGFLNCFKRKLEQNVSILRSFSMQNQDLLSQMSSLSPQLCIEIKSFEQYLQTHCHLQMKNEQKFQDISKQIGIDNQKTSFAYLHPPIEIMDLEDDYSHVQPEKMMMISSQEGQFTNTEKKRENAFVQTK